jgi:hypothetical protein
MARRLDYCATMKFRLYSGALSALLLVGACTPISPSVHKSTLKPSTPLEQPPKQDQDTEVFSSVPIEARWLLSEQSLNAALEAQPTALVVRLSSISLEKLKTDGVVSLELPVELAGKPLQKARILLRTQLDAPDLEQALSDETWSFEWDSTHSNTLEIRSFYGKKANETLILPEALVSVHVVLQRDTSP